MKPSGWLLMAVVVDGENPPKMHHEVLFWGDLCWGLKKNHPKIGNCGIIFSNSRRAVR